MQLKNKLEYYYKTFDISKISPDPLEFPKRFSYDRDIEISGLISSVFAYGRVEMIKSVLNDIHGVMGASPSDFIKNYNSKLFPQNIRYRFYSNNDIKIFFQVLSGIYKNYGSFENFFISCADSEFKLKKMISCCSVKINSLFSELCEITHGLKFMFPDPLKGSACKRFNLFLRWMVRKDSLDFGIWKKINKSDLIIPLDTHIAKIAKQLKLTSKKNSNWSMAEEITENLKKYDSEDPVKYDFSLCHIGIRKLKF